MRHKAAVTTAGIIAAGTLAWAVPTLAHAEDSDTAAAPEVTAVDETDGTDGTDGTDESQTDRREAMRTELADRLAEELGLDGDDVAAALEKVAGELRAEQQADRMAAMEERLAEAVEEGRITQERADELLQAAEDGELPGRMGRGHGGPRGFGPGGDRGPGADLAPDAGTDSGTSSSTTAYTL